MLQMHRIVADTSFLIAIHKLQLFNQVRALYYEVYITKKIAEEFQLKLLTQDACIRNFEIIGEASKYIEYLV